MLYLLSSNAFSAVLSFGSKVVVLMLFPISATNNRTRFSSCEHSPQVTYSTLAVESAVQFFLFLPQATSLRLISTIHPKRDFRISRTPRIQLEFAFLWKSQFILRRSFQTSKYTMNIFERESESARSELR